MSFYSTLPWIASNTARFEMRIPQVAGQLEILRPIIQLFAFKKTKQHTQKKIMCQTASRRILLNLDLSSIKLYIYIYTHTCTYHICPIFGKHCECNAQKCTNLKRLPPLASHSLLLSHYVLTQHEGQKKKVKTTWQTPVVEQTLLGISEHASVQYANCEIEPDASYHSFVECRLLVQTTNHNLCSERKNSINAENNESLIYMLFKLYVQV